MDSDSWTRFSSSSRRYQSRSDLYNVGEEHDGDEELRSEFLCPFCADEFDIVGLCCHIDEEHAVEVKNGVCPVCAKRVGMDLVGHITMQHGSLLKVQRKRRFRRGGSNSTLAILRKELREGNLPSFLGVSSHLVSSSSVETDPLLSSFIFSPPASSDPPSVQPASSAKARPIQESSNKIVSERNAQQTTPLSEKDQEKRAQKCEFVHGLLLSTILEDGL